MRRGAVFVTGVLACLLGGCFLADPVRTSSFKERFRNLDLVDTTNLVQIEVRLIETRFGDSFINQQLWDSAMDEQAVPFEQRGNLLKNGLRVGRVAGAMPPRLEELMTLERSCVNPRLLMLAAGKTSTIHLGPVRPECAFQVEQSGQRIPVELAQAQISLLVVPGLAENGNLCLRFTPKVEFGENVSHFQPAQDRSGWIMEIKRQSQVYSELSWDVTLTPNAFLVIGGSLEDRTSLGCQAFADTQTAPPMQRLLVLRTCRTTDAGIDSQIAPCPVNGVAAHAPPAPLALQAADTVSRASGN